MALMTQETRIRQLEDKPAVAVSKEDIEKALNDHPEIVAFRALRAKWNV